MTKCEVQENILEALIKLDKDIENGKVDPRKHFDESSKIYDYYKEISGFATGTYDILWDKAVVEHGRMLGFRVK